jgi:hypothetical protein
MAASRERRQRDEVERGMNAAAQQRRSRLATASPPRHPVGKPDDFGGDRPEQIVSRDHFAQRPVAAHHRCAADPSGSPMADRVGERVLRIKDERCAGHDVRHIERRERARVLEPRAHDVTVGDDAADGGTAARIVPHDDRPDAALQHFLGGLRERGAKRHGDGMFARNRTDGHGAKPPARIEACAAAQRHACEC